MKQTWLRKNNKRAKEDLIKEQKIKEDQRRKLDFNKMTEDEVELFKRIRIFDFRLVFVKNFPHIYQYLSVHKTLLGRQFMGRYGVVDRISVCRESTGEQFLYIKYKDVLGAALAIQALNDYRISEGVYLAAYYGTNRYCYSLLKGKDSECGYRGCQYAHKRILGDQTLVQFRYLHKWEDKRIRIIRESLSQVAELESMEVFTNTAGEEGYASNKAEVLKNFTRSPLIKTTMEQLMEEGLIDLNAYSEERIDKNVKYEPGGKEVQKDQECIRLAFKEEIIQQSVEKKKSLLPYILRSLSSDRYNSRLSFAQPSLINSGSNIRQVKEVREMMRSFLLHF